MDMEAEERGLSATTKASAKLRENDGIIRILWSGAPMRHCRPGRRKSRRMAARSASFRFLRSATGWHRARSSSLRIQR